MSDSALTSSRYAASASACSGATISWAIAASAATTQNVAPWRVSGRVVNTVTVRPEVSSGSAPSAGAPSITNFTCAPSERPIQLRCMASTRSGQWPSSSPMSSSKRWA